MGKLPDLDAFDRRQIGGVTHEPFRFLNRQTAGNFKTVNGLCNARFIEGISSPRPTKVSLPNARHLTVRLDWAREHRDYSVEDWKR
ncbi:hypothetical protein TNCV_137031 [Trichonephila clavipes]|nr:hypothetical protein TNCV_137031 [Trichonephila clavipes]